jgi:hypothetical protein
MNTYYIVVHGPQLKSSRIDIPHSYYVVHAESLSVAYDKVKIRHKGGRLFVRKDKSASACWKELG